MLRIREALLEQPDLPMRLGETKRRVQVRISVGLRGVGGLLVRVGPIVVCNSNLVRGTYTLDTDAHVRKKGSASSTGRR